MKRKNKCWRIAWLGLFLWFGALGAQVIATPQPLPIDQAFAINAWATNAQTLVVQWDIAPGYYLYRDRLHFSPTAGSNIQLGFPQLPSAIKKYNSVWGDYLAYENKVRILIPVLSANTSPFTSSFNLEVKFQGCSSQGFCYPPTVRYLPINFTGKKQPILGSTNSSLDRIPSDVYANNSNKSTNPLTNSSGIATWLSFFVLGLLISLTPCVLPMIPVLSGLIIGRSDMSHMRAFLISVAYVLGMAITFAFIGFLFSLLGENLQAFMQKPWIIVLFSLIFVAMALALFGFYSLQPPEKIRAFVARLSNRQQRGSLIGAAVMGSLSTLILSPCATPPLVAALSYVSQTGDIYLGGIALFIMGLGMGAPLLLIGAFGKRLLPKAGAWMRVMENILGIVLLGLAIWILDRILPSWITMLLWAGLSFGVAIYMRTFATAVTLMQKFFKAIGLLIFVYGVLLVAGAVQGNTDPLHPLRVNTTYSVSSRSNITVKTIAALEQQMALAKGNPVILDFYADWCVTCKLIERRIFANPAVQQQLNGVIPIRVDVTANDSNALELLRHFHVITPPTILFFNRQHQELNQLRLIGEISVTEFITQVKKMGL